MEEIPFQVVSLEQVPSQLQNQAQESLQSPGNPSVCFQPTPKNMSF